MADNARMVDHEIFRYEANDLTRGWVVEEFYIWPASNRAEIGTADGQYQMCTSLATDTIGSVGFDAICDAADNRQIAWVQDEWVAFLSLFSPCVVKSNRGFLVD